MKRSLLLSLFTCLALLFPLSSNAVTITISYTDGAGEGFNDPTLGAARKAAFEYAAGIWANRLSGTVPIVIDAQFNPLGGTGVSALLGFASPGTLARDFPGAPIAGTWYAIALANQLFGSDGFVGAEITAVFNSDVDNATVLGTVDWYYGLDENAGSDISFVRTCLHEFGHGLGFLGAVTTDGGGDNPDGTYLGGGFPGAYDRFIENNAGTDLTAMTTGTRLAALTGDDLYWFGTNVTTSVGSRPRMYAPGTWEPGSSYSHFREATPVLGVEELMEPILNGDTIVLTHTDNAFADIGWTILGPTNLPTMDFSGGNPTTINEGSGPQVFTVTISSANSQPVSAVLQLNPNGTDTATIGVDYTVSSTSVSIPTGTSTTFSITAPTDADASGETFTMRLTGIVGAQFSTFPTIQRTVTINSAASVTEWEIMQ